jgi:hypothetical protein
MYRVISALLDLLTNLTGKRKEKPNYSSIYAVHWEDLSFVYEFLSGHL